MVGAILHRVLYNNITLPGVFYGNLCIVNNGIMNSGMVGELVYRVLYIIQPCQEYFISSGLIYSPFLYSK